MNIIRIPPVNNMKKINGNHASPVSILIDRNIIDDNARIRNLAFIGFLEFERTLNFSTIRVDIIILVILFFLSLKKILVLDTKDLEKNF